MFSNSGPNTFNDNETIAKYEIMDGAPVRGDIHAMKEPIYRLKMFQVNPSQFACFFPAMS